MRPRWQYYTWMATFLAILVALALLKPIPVL